MTGQKPQNQSHKSQNCCLGLQNRHLRLQNRKHLKLQIQQSCLRLQIHCCLNGDSSESQSSAPCQRERLPGWHQWRRRRQAQVSQDLQKDQVFNLFVPWRAYFLQPGRHDAGMHMTPSLPLYDSTVPKDVEAAELCCPKSEGVAGLDAAVLKLNTPPLEAPARRQKLITSHKHWIGDRDACIHTVHDDFLPLDWRRNGELSIGFTAGGESILWVDLPEDAALGQRKAPAEGLLEVAGLWLPVSSSLQSETMSHKLLWLIKQPSVQYG